MKPKVIHKLWYIDTYMGITLLRGPSVKAMAIKWALLNVGRMNFKYVRMATDEDLAWVETMGGRIHSL